MTLGASRLTADILESTPAQAKNWLQKARAYMSTHYADTCALIAKRGVCYQCLELRDFFASGEPEPLAPGPDHITQRLRLAATMRDRPWGPGSGVGGSVPTGVPVFNPWSDRAKRSIL